MIPERDVAFALLAFSSLLAIVNPLGAIPIYLSMTAGYDAARRRSTLRLAIAAGIIVLVVFGLAGTWILQFFGITTEAFRITGGILFFGIGSDMLKARRPRDKGSVRSEEEEAGRRDEIGVMPLGIPSLAGPGAITTIITLSAQSTSVTQFVGIYGAIFAVMAISWLVLSLAPKLLKLLGKTGLDVMTRLMGLLAMVIGVQMIIDGVRTIMERVIS